MNGHYQLYLQRPFVDSKTTGNKPCQLVSENSINTTHHPQGSWEYTK